MFFPFNEFILNSDHIIKIKTETNEKGHSLRIFLTGGSCVFKSFKKQDEFNECIKMLTRLLN